jgi:hypothetical protein
MPAPSRDIEIVIEQHDPHTERFLMSANALHRGEADPALGLDFTGYTLRERAMLAALLTMRSGFKCNRTRIDRMAGELKRDGIDTVLLGLRLKGHLRITRTNGEGGRFTYRWRVSERPITEWAEAESAEREQRQVNAGGAKAARVSAGRTMPGKSGHGDAAATDSAPDDVSAGRTMPGSTTHGSTKHGSAMRGSTGHSKKIKGEEDQGEENPPPTPAADGSPPAEPEARGEVAPRFDDETRARLAAAVDRVLVLKPGWRPDDVRAAMLAEIDAGRTPAVVADAVVRLAGDPASNGPGRLRAAGPWWNPAAEPDGVRVVHGAHHQCPKHRGELAHNCAPCRTAARLAEVEVERARRAAEVPAESAPAGPSAVQLAASAAARAAAARAAADARRPQPRPRPTLAPTAVVITDPALVGAR